MTEKLCQCGCSTPVTKKSNKYIRGHNRKNKKISAENKIIKILKTIDDHGFEFVGDFSTWIGGKNPDFLNKNNNKIIEMFGDYWHSEKITGLTKIKHENERKDHFIKFGYSILIIWEHELKNINKVTNKILNFLEV